MAGTRIYSPQLGTDIDQGISNLGSMFAPPTAAQLQAQQTILASQATQAQKADALAKVATAYGSGIAGLYGAGDNDAVKHDATYQQFRNSQADDPNIAKLDLGNYALGGDAGKTFIGASQKPIGENEVTAPSPLLGALGIKPTRGIVSTSNDQKVLPNGTIVGQPDQPDDGDNSKWAIVGKDKFGNPIYGYPPSREAYRAGQEAGIQPTPTAPGSSSMGPAISAPLAGALFPQQGNAAGAANIGTQPTPPGTAPQTQADVMQLHGDDFLKTLDPDIAGQVKSIVQGRTPYPTGMMLKTPYGQQLATYVTQADPTFESGNAGARVKVRNEFETGGPNSVAGTITAGNTAISHMLDLSNASEAMGGGGMTDVPFVNGIVNGVQKQTGGGIPQTQYGNTLRDLAGEITKFYRGVGGTEGDINGTISALDPNQSLDQRRAAIAKQADLMNNKISELQTRWKTGMGPMAGDFPIVSPQAQAALGTIAKRGPAPTQTSSVAAGPGGIATAPAAGPAAASVASLAPPATAAPAPQTTGSDPLAAARAAIAAGAPRDAVMQRLQAAGLPTAGL